MPIELSPEEIARSHRWHAVECNNLAWSLSDSPDRTRLQDEDMLNAAHASAYHWSRVGTDLNRARAMMLLGHVHAAVGHGTAALAYAQDSFDYLTAHDPPDWEIAFAHAVLAHAAFAAGRAELHLRHFVEARELGQAIADPEDKRIFFKTFNLIPQPQQS
jgi:hypothetical protein